MNLTITDAADVISLRLWDHKTYKEFSSLIDLSSKLTGASTENIEITPSDLGLTYFDGIYFIEAEDNTETSLKYTYLLDKYDDCILVKVLENESCISCSDKQNTELQNINTLKTALVYALELGYINEMLRAIKVLDKYCTNECGSCKGTVDDISSYENSNPDTIDIIIDGGDISS